MWPVTSTRDISILVRQEKYVSIILADGFDIDLIAWIYTRWEALNAESDMHWHIAIPSSLSSSDINRGSNPYSVPASSFSVEFSEKIRLAYGIDKIDLPCIVFDDCLTKSQMPFVRLGDKNSHELKMFFVEVSERVKNISDLERASKTRLSKQERSKHLHKVLTEQANDNKDIFGVCANVCSIISLMGLL